MGAFRFKNSILLIGAFLTVLKISSQQNEICSTIDGYITEFRQQIVEEKSKVPEAKVPLDPTSINGVVEISGDTQRIFEYIDDNLSISSLSGDEQESLKEEIYKCPSFQELVSDCESIIPEAECDPESPYRTHDGTCNNLQNTRWGALFAEYRRTFPAHYSGTSLERLSVAGDALPQSRNLSIKVLHTGGPSDKQLSQMFMFFGQLIAHDITESTTPKVNGRVPPCCPPNKVVWCQTFTHFSGTTCLAFVKSSPYPTCELGKRQHMNGVPAFIDCHITYGRTASEAEELRTHDESGKLKVQKSKHDRLMLPNVSSDDLFCHASQIDKCFQQGDSRVNQHTTLMALETLFLLEHNRLAGKLRKINPHWDGERIYQEARKLNGAQMQCITYKEYLPHLLGDDAMDQNDLRIGSDTQYDPDVDPSVTNEFSSFGFRLHNTVNSMVGKSGCARMRLMDTTPNPLPLHKGCMGSFLSQTTLVPQKLYEPSLVSDMYDHLLRPEGSNDGLDIGATDVARGRNHGSPPYADVLAYTLGEPIEDFQDLLRVMSQDRIDKLKENYVDVRDVDPWMGMIFENPVSDSILGPTALKMSIDHFRRLKMGDRFYFENQGLHTSFTKDQVEELRKCSLSSMICANSDVTHMPPEPFLLPGHRNQMRPCSLFKEINLRPWKENV